jgi:sec-independent protein translocase protein TatA
MMGIGAFQPLHLLLILVIVMVVFGAGKLGQVGAALGQSVKEFKASVNEDPEVLSADEAAGDDMPAKPALPAAPETRSAVDPHPATLLRREEI